MPRHLTETSEWGVGEAGFGVRRTRTDLGWAGGYGEEKEGEGHDNG